jgi:hypothetical protein
MQKSLDFGTESFRASKNVIFYVIYLGIMIIIQLTKNKLDDFDFDVIYAYDY